MRVPYVTIIAVAMTVARPLCAEPQSVSTAGWSTTGRDLYEKCASADGTIAHACGEYLLGLLDGVAMAMPADAQLVCPPHSFSFFQLETAYLDWAKANPALLDRGRGIDAAAALAAAFPCSTR